jgi:hypothetical protein
MKKAIYLARVAKGAKDAKETESKETPRASLESMVTTMQALTEALSTQQEEAPMAEKKQTTFAAEEELESLFGMTVEVETKPPEEGSIAAYFADETDTDNPPERASLKSPTLPPGGTLNEMKQKYSKMMETLEKQEKQERDAKAEQAAKDHHDEEEGNLAARKAERKAAEEPEALEIQKLATAMREVEEKLDDIEIAKMEKAIAAQVRKYAEEQEMKERAAAIKERERVAAAEAAQLAAEKEKKAENLKTTQDEEIDQEEIARTKKADEILEAETDTLNRATWGLHQAREERPVREESTPGKKQGSSGY